MLGIKESPVGSSRLPGQSRLDGPVLPGGEAACPVRAPSGTCSHFTGEFTYLPFIHSFVLSLKGAPGE